VKVKTEDYVGKSIVPILKALVAGLLVYWLIATKKITLDPFVQLWTRPWLLVLVTAVILAGILINNYRWLLLLRGQKISSDTGQTLSLTFIGLFFNLAMPGSVGGDLIRAYYIVQENPKAKVGAGTSVLMDRIVGLYAMALLAFAVVILFPQKIFSTPQLKALGLFITLLSVGFTGFFIVGFSDWVRNHPWTEKLFEKLPGGHLLRKVYDAIHAFRSGKTQFLWGIVLSLIVQSGFVVLFYIIAPYLGYDNVTLPAIFFVFPLGLIASAIPVSPGGVGVGQAMFLALFTWYGGGIDPTVGPTVMTIFQVVLAAY
jgi:glycosyltransferase 2 family protein